MGSQANCAPGDWTSCTQNPYAKLGLAMLDELGHYLASSTNFSGNYQFLGWTESAGATRYLTLRFWVSSWSGLSSTSFAIAWATGG